MENMEKRYTLYIKIGDNELSVSGEESGYIREMLEEFKYLHAGKIKAASPVKEIAPAGREANSATVEEPGLVDLYKKTLPKKEVDKALLYLYYLHQKGETKGVRPREISRAIVSVGEKAPNAISTTLGYMKRLGLVEMKDRFWSITEEGINRVEKKLVR
ncbi:MAG: hypothetical protein ACP5QG_03885 [candidate division WOR-3 bacterium]